MKENTVKILISGGHVTPAIAIIEQLKERKVSILFVGRNTTDTSKSRSKEKLLMSELDVPFKAIDTAKYYVYPKYKNLAIPFTFTKGLIQSFKIIDAYKPDVFVSFGGYVALPLAIVCKLKNIPIVTHEQTHVIGRTNNILSRIATKRLISWPNTKGSRETDILTGNPIRSAFFSRPVRPDWFSKSDKPVLFITGGNQGAQAVNNWIFENLHGLVEKFKIVHQTGDTRSSADYKTAKLLKKNITDRLQQFYLPKKYLNQSDMSWMLHRADVVISRAGANTVTELLLLQKNCVLIPLPISSKREQYINAKTMESLGLAFLLRQDDLSETDALSTVQMMNNSSSNLDTSQIEALVKLHSKAATTISDIILACTSKKSDQLD